MNTKLTYSIGRIAGNLVKEFPLISASAVLGTAFLIVGTFIQQKETTTTTLANKNLDSSLIKDKARCAKDKQFLIAESDKAKSKSQFHEAAYLLSTCIDITGDIDLKQRFKDNSISHWTGVVNDKNSSFLDKYKAYERLSELDIDNRAQLKIKSDHFKKLADEKTVKETTLARAKAEKEAAEAENIRKRQAKKEGVTIGMSQQAVLESSWGRPERVNRSVTQHGVHEQWAYPGYNYLHFEDGTLTSIHTSKN